MKIGHRLLSLDLLSLSPPIPHPSMSSILGLLKEKFGESQSVASPPSLDGTKASVIGAEKDTSPAAGPNSTKDSESMAITAAAARAPTFARDHNLSIEAAPASGRNRVSSPPTIMALPATSQMLPPLKALKIAWGTQQPHQTNTAPPLLLLPPPALLLPQ